MEGGGGEGTKRDGGGGGGGEGAQDYLTELPVSTSAIVTFPVGDERQRENDCAERDNERVHYRVDYSWWVHTIAEVCNFSPKCITTRRLPLGQKRRYR